MSGFLAGLSLRGAAHLARNKVPPPLREGVGGRGFVSRLRIEPFPLPQGEGGACASSAAVSSRAGGARDVTHLSRVGPRPIGLTRPGPAAKRHRVILDYGLAIRSACGKCKKS